MEVKVIKAFGIWPAGDEYAPHGQKLSNGEWAPQTVNIEPTELAQWHISNGYCLPVDAPIREQTETTTEPEAPAAQPRKGGSK